MVTRERFGFINVFHRGSVLGVACVVHTFATSAGSRIFAPKRANSGMTAGEVRWVLCLVCSQFRGDDDKGWVWFLLFSILYPLFSFFLSPITLKP
jgi:hypothetical protein